MMSFYGLLSEKITEKNKYHLLLVIQKKTNMIKQCFLNIALFEIYFNYSKNIFNLVFETGIKNLFQSI